MSRHPKTARHRWHQWTEAEATAALDDFAAGLTPTEFCAQRGISRSRLAYWRERLSTLPAAASPAFVEVTRSIPARSNARIEITRHGVVLRVHEDIDCCRL
ncbi:MAG: hypothetical protein Q8S73_11175 [Deltaproteobacteria bacterium]|nr:hypothetical protein [Myxococcales bacterium]MDP3214658.1 hypothetical protein [Deltaproteobacteria bacterium]